MIIKTAGEEGSWRFYDNVREVQSSQCDRADVFHVDGMGKEEQCGVMAEVDGVIHENMLDADAIHNACQRIAFFDHRDTPRHLYVNRETYLLNDAGKTIERLF